MCPKKSSISEKSGYDVRHDAGLSEILQYEPPVLKENRAGCYIEFRAFDPALGSLRRKTIKLNHIKGATARRKYAKGLLIRLNEQLQHGWNPWIAKDIENLMLYTESLDLYENYIDKMYADGLYRKETYVGYKSYLKILRLYNEKHNKIYYVYQFDKRYCSAFLDYVFLERNVGAQTRNNYLGFLRVFSGFLIQKTLLQSRPTDGISPISKRLYTKERDCIPLDKLESINEYLSKNDPYFLTACYLLYYCFVRPVEMTRLQIKHFNINQSTLTIPAECSKNHTTQSVTIPKKVLFYMIDLKIFSAPMSDYLFGEKMSPGKNPIDTKIFRDHWEKMRKALKLDKRYKFYSLKDTGISEMLESNVASITVRDQARHSSLQITDIYARNKRSVKASKEIQEFEGSF